jgi:hypothetical protein
LSIDPAAPVSSLKPLLATLEAARQNGRLGPADVHRFSILLVFEDEIKSEKQLQIIEHVMGVAAEAGIGELALDAQLLESARLRIGVQSLLNILQLDHLSRLFSTARSRQLRLTYRYRLDVESMARTIWTGLHSARVNGFSAGKYGLLPMTLEEQAAVVEMITTWTAGWSAIPAFYVDTPLLTADDVYPESRCKEAAKLWLKTVRGAGVKLVLFDSPDRVTPRKLVRPPGAVNDVGVFTLADIEEIESYARELGVSILWSGGITSRQAFDLAKRKVSGIFSTSSTAAKIAVTAAFERDPRLPAENEPTEFGVRRIHAIIQGGFLSTVLRDHQPELARSIETVSERLLAAEKDPLISRTELENLDEQLFRGWQAWAGFRPGAVSTISVEEACPVPADAVRVFRGRKSSAFSHTAFVEKLGIVFMPLTVQMQRRYGLSAYLPAVLPETKPGSLPDEIALVFYRTKESYQEAKRCVGGRAYSELHQLVFDMPQSPSNFPEILVSTVQASKAYHLFPKSVDWQNGTSRLSVGVVRAGITKDGFLNGISQVALALQKNRGSVDAVIFCTGDDWVVWWEHSSDAAPDDSFRFPEVADDIFSSFARPVRIPVSLVRPYAGVSLNSQGDFVNFQFPRV